MPFPKKVGIDISAFETMRFQLHVKPGDSVSVGDVILEDKACPGRVIITPYAGKIIDIVRGAKRRILHVIIECSPEQPPSPFQPAPDLDRNGLIDHLKRCGLFASIYQRPCSRLADPSKPPQAIFVKALDSAPFAPPPLLEINAMREDFLAGLDALKKLTDGPVHVMVDQPADLPDSHVCKGPHPIGSHSIHIEHLSPIRSQQALVWTIHAHHVIAIGHLIKTGRLYSNRIISIAGEGIREEERGFFRVFDGHSIEELLENHMTDQPSRLISGDPLMGCKAGKNDFLGREHFTLCAIPEVQKRTLLHFLGLGCKRFYSNSHLPVCCSANAPDIDEYCDAW